MLSLEVTNDLAELEKLNRHIENFCEIHGIENRNAFELNLAIDEVFSNIVSHGFKDHEIHLIKIELKIINREVTVRIEDDGVPFDPTAAPKSDLNCPVENRKIGGIGLHLINQLMDQVIYKRQKGKNILFLIKQLNNQ